MPDAHWSCEETRHIQSMKTDIGKPFDKSITIDNSNLHVIDFIDQSIEIHTQNHRCSFKVLNLLILSFSCGYTARYAIIIIIIIIIFMKDRVLLTLVNANNRFFQDSV